MNAAELNKRWKVGAKHALYIHDGHWYHCLKEFPGAFFDDRGYLLFQNESDYRRCKDLKIYDETNQVSISPPGISAIPGYVRVETLSEPEADVDIHAETLAAEGNRRLRTHLAIERKAQNAKAKKQSAQSLDCETRGFSFLKMYGGKAESYCEVHHLVPLKSLKGAKKPKLEDLAILCSNCHRVVHLRYPPYTLDEVRQMIDQRRSMAATQALA